MEGGVLLIGYEMYRALASGIKLPKLKGRKGKMLLEEKRNISRGMLKDFITALVFTKKGVKGKFLEGVILFCWRNQ